MKRVNKRPVDHFEGKWEKGKKYTLYAIVKNNGTLFRSLTPKEKDEPYVIYDSTNETFSANAGWEIVELSEDSRMSAGGNISKQDVETALEPYAKSADLSTVATSGSYSDLSNIPTDLVKTSAQTFTEAQKSQARTNLGAASAEEVEALADQKYEGPYDDGELPSASADTMGAIYLVGPDNNDEYERFVTRLSGSTYSWVSLGKTGVNLANYATNSKVSQLEAKVDDLDEKKVEKNPASNLVDKNDKDVKRGYYLEGNVLRQGSSYDTTGYIPVLPETTYSAVLEAGTMRFVSFYDGNKDYLSNTQNVTTFTTPQNCEYVRITYYASKWNYAGLNVGAERLHYEEYNPVGGYLPVPAKEFLIELKGFANFGPTAGVTQNGESYYNTDFKQIWQAVNFDTNRYRVVPFYPGAIYTYDGNFYVWNGEDLVKAPTDMLTLSEIVSTLSQEVQEVSNELANIGNTIDPVLDNPLNGVSFGVGTPQNIREAISKVWIDSPNPNNVQKVIDNAPNLYVRYIGNAVGNYQPQIDIYTDLSAEDAAFVWFEQSQETPRATKQVVRLYCATSYNNEWGLGVDRAFINIEIDWSKISGRNSNLPILLETAKLQRIETEKVSLSAVKSSVVQNSLYGKTIVCFGDSITELADTSGIRYSDYLGMMSNANIINVGIGGSQLRQRLEPVTTPTSNGVAYAALDVVNMVTAAIEQDFTKQIAAAEYLRDHASDDNTAIVARLQTIDWSKVDIVTFFAGTNDWYGGANYGESGSLDKSRTLGAINWIIQNLLSTYPHLKIFWFTPIIRWVDYSGGTGTVEGFGDTYKPGAYTLKEFSALIQNEVGLSHIPVCDLYNTLGWNMWNFSNYFPNNDGTHPRKPDGMRGIGARFFAFLLANKNS